MRFFDVPLLAPPASRRALILAHHPQPKLAHARKMANFCDHRRSFVPRSSSAATFAFARFRSKASGHLGGVNHLTPLSKIRKFWQSAKNFFENLTDYSLRRLFTGLASAALIDCKLIVNMAITTAANPPIAKIHQAE